MFEIPLMIIGILMTGYEAYQFIRRRRRENNRVSNVKIIKELRKSHDNTTFHNVGELRALLEYFSDDIEVRAGMGTGFLQLREIDGKGSIFIGGSSTWEPKQ